MTESTCWETEAIQQQLDKQSRFCGWQLFDHDSLRIQIGSVLRDEPTNSLPNPLRYDDFSPEERDRIETVFQKIRQIPSPINFGCTFVTVYRRRKQNEEIILFRCSLPGGKIFIESTGRVYKDWSDFIRCNKIENGCEYFAPADGVYTADGQIWKHKKRNIIRYFDTTFTVAGLVCIVATEISFISSVLSGVIYFYGVYRCVSKIIDRYKHEESIHNAETIFIYLTLLTICLTQLCVAAVSYKEYFFAQFGVRWCKLVLSTVNGTVLCLDAICFVVSFSIFYSKIKAEKLTTSDAFDLLLRAFLLYEQAINTIEFLELLSDTSYFRSLQKTKKANWKKRKSKETKRNAAGKSKFFEYQNDFFYWMKRIGNQILSRSGEFLMKNFVQSLMSFAGAVAAGTIARVWQQSRQ